MKKYFSVKVTLIVLAVFVLMAILLSLLYKPNPSAQPLTDCDLGKQEYRHLVRGVDYEYVSPNPSPYTDDCKSIRMLK